jgi:two-component system response regulator PrrA
MDVVSTTPRVMVVADDADVMTPSERGLRVSGFDVSSAKNGAESVPIVTRAPPGPVVVDVNPHLPGPAITSSPETIAVGPPTIEISQRRARVNGVEIRFTRLLHTVPGAGFVLRARE